MARGEFVTVKCDGCGNEQVVFSKPASDINCVVCDDLLAESTGGKADFKSQVVETVA
ncbi:MAG: 30S ribosomal protein S27e [Candidatus Nanohaloarchaea archaeon]|nr:30S ribosomal protein S27e [Candidatus Nanohaloarchaea archaeon]